MQHEKDFIQEPQATAPFLRQDASPMAGATVARKASDAVGSHTGAGSGTGKEHGKNQSVNLETCLVQARRSERRLRAQWKDIASLAEGFDERSAMTGPWVQHPQIRDRDWLRQPSPLASRCAGPIA